MEASRKVVQLGKFFTLLFHQFFRCYLNKSVLNFVKTNKWRCMIRYTDFGFMHHWLSSNFRIAQICPVIIFSQVVCNLFSRKLNLISNVIFTIFWIFRYLNRAKSKTAKTIKEKKKKKFKRDLIYSTSKTSEIQTIIKNFDH